MPGTQSALQGRAVTLPSLAILRSLAVCALAATGCNGGNGGADAGGGSPGSGGAGGSGAPGGSGGGAGTGGGGGAPLASCPAAVPADGQACATTASCFYEDCAGSGRSVATCANGAWSVQPGACTGAFCFSRTCAVGQVCLMRAGGALLVDCVSNTCGTASIGCGCLQSCLGSTCSVSGSLQTGVTIQCNTCPSNQCA
jgi:hypothetical protein